MRINSQFLKRLGGLGIATFTRHWMGSLDYRYAAYQPHVDPASEQFDGPAIYLFWHEYIPFLFYLRGHCRIAMLISKHGDAEWLSCAARHMGFSLIRGSTNRGGAKAMRELITSSRLSNIAITPDGPRGPRRHLAAGPIYLASRTGLPLVLCGLGYSACWRFRTWDRLALPKPTARARAVVSPFLHVPPELNRDGIEHHRQLVENSLNQLTQSAEHWARTGMRMENEQPTRRQPMPWNCPMRARIRACAAGTEEAPQGLPAAGMQAANGSRPIEPSERAA
ncbi:MAG: lysophospholipid acyltransferase family protein [Planctomycetales bacterium]|nr:lysophospholipid acyltransferase family protein [Planctomycetales bacterium]